MAAINTQAVTDDITKLAATSGQGYANAAIEDGIGLLESSEELVQRYSDQLANKEIDQDQVEDDLSQDLLALANMEKLKDAGLAEIRISQFTEGVIGILVRAAITAAVGAL